MKQVLNTKFFPQKSTRTSITMFKKVAVVVFVLLVYSRFSVLMVFERPACCSLPQRWPFSKFNQSVILHAFNIFKGLFPSRAAFSRVSQPWAG